MNVKMGRILLGDNPLIGVDHLMRDRARERSATLGVQRAIETFDRALLSGAQGICFATHPLIYETLMALRTRGTERPLELYPVLPYAMDYVRTATEKGVGGLARDMLGRLGVGSMMGLGWRAGTSLLSLDPLRLFKLYLDMELSSIMAAAPRDADLRSVFLHEAATDACLSFQALDILLTYRDHIQAKFGAVPGFATRNLARFLQLWQDHGEPLGDIAIMTPINKAGFQMYPNQDACEAALASADGAHIVAVSVLAAGYLSLEEAVDYLSGLPNIGTVVVGTSQPSHAETTFQYLRDRWASLPSEMPHRTTFFS